jgi:heptosyltransferase-1
MSQSILIVKLSSLGDVIHTLPAAQALRRRFPDAHLAWAVERSHAGVLRGQPFLDDLIEWNRGTLRGWLDFIGRLRQTTWDTAVDFQGLQRSAIVTRLSGAKRRIGFGPGREHSHLWYNHRVTPPKSPLHAVEKSLRLLVTLGASFEGLPLARKYLGRGEASGRGSAPAASEMFPLPIGTAEREAVEAWLDAERIDTTRKPLAILNPHCRKAANIWPAVRYSALAEKLAADGAEVVVTGGPIAKSLCDEIAAPLGGRVHRADGVFTLLGSAELIRRANVFVTGDTGPMHIAAAVGTPIVALFGPADPLRTGPYAADAVVLTKRLPCSPCFASQCPLGHAEPPCMTDITVEEVHNAVRRRLSEAAPPARRRSA